MRKVDKIIKDLQDAMEDVKRNPKGNPHIEMPVGLVEEILAALLIGQILDMAGTFGQGFGFEEVFGEAGRRSATEEHMRQQREWQQANFEEFAEKARRYRDNYEGSDFFRNPFGDSSRARSEYEQRDRYEPPKAEKKRPWHVVLGVRATATHAEIKKAYQRLAMQLHPDRPGGDTKKFQELQEAKRESGI